MMNAFLNSEKEDLFLLDDVLQIPDQITCYNGTVVSGIEAIYLPKKIFLSVPTSGHDTKVWKNSARALHNKQLLSELYLRPMKLLNTMNQAWLSPNCLQLFADAIYAKGAPLDNCWGFVDGTVRPYCRPGIN